MAEVDPFDIEFEEEKPKKSLGIFEKALKKMEEGKPLTKKEQAALEEAEFEDLQVEDTPVADVPEIETEIKDLPPEEENEKELIVERQDDDKTLVDNDETIIDEESQLAPVANVDENGEIIPDVVDPEEEMPDIPTEKEIADSFQEDIDKLKKENQDLKDKKEEPKKGVVPKPAKQKKDKKDKNTYEHYPVGVRLIEVTGKVIDKGIDLADSAATKQLGGASINNAVENSRTVPHYDYTSMFGRH